MLGCLGCCMEHADRLLSMKQKKTSVHPSESEKNSGFEIVADAGDEVRISRRFLISPAG